MRSVFGSDRYLPPPSRARKMTILMPFLTHSSVCHPQISTADAAALGGRQMCHPRGGTGNCAVKSAINPNFFKTLKNLFFHTSFFLIVPFPKRWVGGRKPTWNKTILPLPIFLTNKNLITSPLQPLLDLLPTTTMYSRGSDVASHVSVRSKILLAFVDFAEGAAHVFLFRWHFVFLPR